MTTPLADVAQLTIDGQRRAAQFLSDLPALSPTGDELYNIVAQYTNRWSYETDLFVRGLLRQIQKELEARA